MAVELIPIKIKKDVTPKDDIAELILSSPDKPTFEENDIIVIAQKIISKQEGRVVTLSEVIPSELALGIASAYGKDPKLVEAILSESKRIVRMENGILIVETNQGFICANAGVDESNIENGFATLLPKDSDLSAKKIRTQLFDKAQKNVAVLISDTFGRPFRMGQTNCAIGISGMDSIIDYKGTKDNFGRTLRVTAIAIADEICSAAELVMGKSTNCPVAIVRNFKFQNSSDTIHKLVRPEKQDLFR